MLGKGKRDDNFNKLCNFHSAEYAALQRDLAKAALQETIEVEYACLGQRGKYRMAF